MNGQSTDIGMERAESSSAEMVAKWKKGTRSIGKEAEAAVRGEPLAENKTSRGS